MALYDVWTDFADEVTVLLELLREFAASGPAIAAHTRFSLDDECFLEGALSRAWQSWGNFCRACVIESCLGTVNGSGGLVSPHPMAASEGHVSSAAIKAKTKKPVASFWGATNSVLRHEPTWGDVDVLAVILPRLQSANHPQLSAAMSSAAQSAKALQRIRNAAAHNNHETMAELLAMRPAYLVFNIAHPVQAMFWIDPVNRDFLVVSALEDLIDCGLSAIS